MNSRYRSIMGDSEIEIAHRLSQCPAGLLTEAGSRCLAELGQHGKYTESECC